MKKSTELKLRKLVERVVREQRRFLKEQDSESGLNVYPRTLEDSRKIKEIIDNSDYYAEWNASEGYFFFPEKESLYDELEKELEDLFSGEEVRYYIEGVF